MKKLTVPLQQYERIAGWIYLFAELFFLPAALSTANLLLPTPLSNAALNFVYFSVNFLSIVVIFHRFLGESFQQVLRSPFRCLRAAAIGYILYHIGNILISYLIVSLYSGFSNVNDSSIHAMTQDNYMLMSIGTVLLVPPVEEILYRGLIFRGLYNRSRAAAYIVSTLVFAAVHVVSYIGLYDPILLLLCFLQYIPAGLCLGFAYASADTIWAPILMHIAINQIGISTMR